MLCLLSILVLAVQATAQTIPGSGPLLAKIPDFAQWTVTYQYPGESARDVGARNSEKAPDLRLRRERIVKTPDVIWFVWESDGAPKEELWLIHGVQWSKSDPSQRPAAALNEQNRLFRKNLPVHRFPGFEWINPSVFIGVQKYAGKECRVFQKPSQSDGLITAYVESQTRLPVCLSAPDALRTYSFGPPPALLQIPQEYAKAIEEDEAQTAKAMKPGAR